MNGGRSVNFSTDVVIIGAGISGCAAAQELEAQGRDYLLLEKNTEPGGLTRSIYIGDAIFDYSGHYLHLANFKSPAEIPYANQDNSDWQVIERKSIVFLFNRMIPAPFQYNLFALPREIREQCLKDFQSRKIHSHPANFKDYLISGFGKAISNIFLIPYNEKQLAIPLENLSVFSATRFFPKPDKEKVENGFVKKAELEPIGYNSHFWYPKYRGIGLLASGLARNLRNLIISCNVIKVDFEKRIVYTSRGKIRFRFLISSIPLKKLCEIGNNSRLATLAKKLSHNRVLCINLLFKGSLPKDLEGIHWVYFPDHDVPFYRLGVYSHLPHSNFPPSQTAVYIEVSVGMNDKLINFSKILDRVFSSLEKLKWLYRKNCVIVSANWIDYAYVHFTHTREKVITQIKRILENYGVYLIGRYGLWDYISMEDSILSGIQMARRLGRE